MPKILAIAGIAVLAIVAPPVGAALLAGGGWAAAGTAAVTALGALAGLSGVGAAISAWGTVALVASTALKPKSVGRGPAGTQVDLQADPLAGIPLMLGTSGTAGKIMHANTTGQADKNTTLFYLLALTAGPIAAVPTEIYANDLPVTLGDHVATAPPQFAGKMFLNMSTGAKPEAAALYPAGIDPSFIPEWSDAHKTSGLACAWWSLTYSTEAYPTGVPKPLFVVNGPPVYDPRQDSTYPGGAGGQRWNDETTWGYGGNGNPFLQALAWAIGRHDNGVLTFGIGAPIEAIDVPAFVEGANVCDANFWLCGGEVLSSDSKWSVLNTILQAGGGEPLKLAGKLSAYVRAPRVVLGALTGRDAIGEVSITGTKRRRDRINQIIPNYRLAEHRYQMVPAGPVVVDAYVTADGGLRSREGTYALVQAPKQAAELAAYDLVDAREFEPISIPLGPKWAGFKPGDCLTIDEPEFGMVAQPVIIQTRDLDLTTGRVTLTCRSETPGKHEYALGRTPNPPPIPGLTPTDPTHVARPDAGTWTATGGVIAGPDGTSIPAIVVTGACNDPNVTGVIIEHRLMLSPGVYGDWASAEYPRTVRRIEIRAVRAASTYHVRVRYRSVRDVEGALFLDLGHVLTGSLISGGVTTIGGMTPNELRDIILAQQSDIVDLQAADGEFGKQWVMAVTSTGPGTANVAGIRLAANPAVSSIQFIADEIGFTNGIDNVYPLAVIGNKVIASNFQADDIKANTITANMIIGGAVTDTVVYAGPLKGNDPTEQVSVEFDYYSIGGMHLISCYGELGTTGTLPGGTVFRVRRNGGEVGSGSLYCPGSWGAAGLSFPVADKPGAGWWHYALTQVATPGSSGSQVNRTLVVLTELKR